MPGPLVFAARLIRRRSLRSSRAVRHMSKPMGESTTSATQKMRKREYMSFLQGREVCHNFTIGIRAKNFTPSPWGYTEVTNAKRSPGWWRTDSVPR